MHATSSVETERVGDTLVMTPKEDLREFDYEHMDAHVGDLIGLLDNGQVRHIVVDFCNTDYYGSSVLSFFIDLWKRVRKGGGQVAFCNVSPHQRQILQCTKLDTLWSIYATREEAVKSLAS